MAPALRILSQYMCAIAANDPATQARYGGLMHAMPQAGLCVVFGIDSTKVRFVIESGVYFAISLLSIVLAYIGTWKYVPETLYGQEENVIVPTREAKALGLGLGDKPVGAEKGVEVEVRSVGK